jgi:hypothetical protein
VKGRTSAQGQRSRAAQVGDGAAEGRPGLLDPEHRPPLRPGQGVGDDGVHLGGGCPDGLGHRLRPRGDDRELGGMEPRRGRGGATVARRCRGLAGADLMDAGEEEIGGVCPPAPDRPRSSAWRGRRRRSGAPRGSRDRGRSRAGRVESFRSATTDEGGLPAGRQRPTIPYDVRVRTAEAGSSARTLAYRAVHREESWGPSRSGVTASVGPTARSISATSLRRARSSHTTATKVMPSPGSTNCTERRGTVIASHHCTEGCRAPAR